jgi:peptidoglycan hydrolase-like protein with peptidoglycan-binding domain
VLGYNPGAIDGRPGGKTADAIRQYQTDKGLLVTGDASAPLLQHLRRNGG